MAIVPGDIIRVAPRLSKPGTGDFVNVYFFEVTAPVTDTDGDILASLATLMDTMYNSFLSSIHTSVNFEDINLFNETQSIPYGNVPWPTLTSGTGGSSDSLPGQVALFMRGLSGFSKSWARKFIGPFVEATNGLDGTIASGLMTQAAAFGALWLAGATAPSSTFMRPVFFATRATVWRPIIEIAISNVWATFRTRRVGRGS